MQAATLQARMGNPAFAVPGAMDALRALGKAVGAAGLPAATRELVETDERIWAVAGWRDAPYFDDAERAALALAEAVTRLGDRAGGVPDAIWEEAARHYDEPQLGALVLTISTVNLWNRLNVTTRQVAGQEW